jgi:tetratricopeptide (TPR) repeat protein
MPPRKFKRTQYLLIYLVLFAACSGQQGNSRDQEPQSISSEDPQWISTFVTPLGKEYTISEPGEKMMEQYQTAKVNYESDPDDVESLIWYGRRTAYLGQYTEALRIYTEGIEKHPNDPRLYRHRGHRYISVREFDKAIADLEKAAVLIQDIPNEIEPDGMPNALNIPVSTLHGNIWYHLGLAYYLDHQYDKAYEAYLKCRDSGSRYDNIVSSTHWLYMIQQRLGNPALADSMLAPITLDSVVIENHSYRDLCNFYKGLVPLDSILVDGSPSSSNDAVRYGIANWYLYNNDTASAKSQMEAIVEGSSFSSFGYIAAEQDLEVYFY